MSAGRFQFGISAVKSRSARLPGAGAVPPSYELYPCRSGTCVVGPFSAMILRGAFSETPVLSMALTLRYPCPPLEAANAPAARTRSLAYLSTPSLAWW